MPLETEEEAKERNEAIIIKKLIGLVKETEFLSAENRASLLDWLEKQGEQKQELLTKEKALKNYPFVEQKHVDLVAILKDYFANTPKEQQDKDWEELKHLNNFGWELIEQKPTWSEEEKKKLDRIYYILGIAADEHAYSNTCRLIGDKEAVELQDFLRSIAKPDQKPAEWSEEDDRMMNDTLAFVERFAGRSRKISVEVSNWLKLLKSRVLSSSLREFDKEEGNVIDHLIAICDDAMCYKTFSGCYDIEKCKRFLTNLKFGIDPQKKQWKPSEAMLEALYRAIDKDVMEKSEDEILLDKLYQGLKYGRVLSNK